MDYWIVKVDANGIKQWDNNYGTTGFVLNEFHDLRQTVDGGYILGGTSDGAASGNKSENSKGSNDYWVIKVDSLGNKIWDKTLGGSGSDMLSSLVQSPDGGYVLGGNSQSPVSGDKTEASKGADDYWIVKLDANGTKLWDRTLGSSTGDILTDLELTADGGLIVAGHNDTTPISGDKTEDTRGFNDFWILRLDANGTKLWDKAIGGTNNDRPYSIQETRDGNFIIGGTSLSKVSGEKSETNKGAQDFWVVMLNSLGQKLWDKTIGGTIPA